MFDVMYTCIHVCLVGTYAQATLHQELSMDLGWKGYGVYRYEEGALEVDL